MKQIDLHLETLSAYDYQLPPELIATEPLRERDQSRLLVVDRATGSIDECHFYDLPHYLHPGDQLFLNDTQVMTARLFARRPISQGKVELLLLPPKETDSFRWPALAKPARKLSPGSYLQLDEQVELLIVALLGNGQVELEFPPHCDGWQAMERYGQLPLPGYMGRAPTGKDALSYQTVYSARPGAVAAPTAGLHFTHRLLEQLEQKGVALEKVTLHVGQGTFTPVRTELLRDHQMHREWCHVAQEVAERTNRRRGLGRRICVGTTSLRCLETMADGEGRLKSGTAMSDLFLYPGCQFKVAEGLITNFHLPRSTLLMLVAAFCGYELMQKAYRYAIEQRFRFYSYGDAMLIL